MSKLSGTPLYIAVFGITLFSAIILYVVDSPKDDSSSVTKSDIFDFKGSNSLQSNTNNQNQQGNIQATAKIVQPAKNPIEFAQRLNQQQQEIIAKTKKAEEITFSQESANKQNRKKPEEITFNNKKSEDNNSENITTKNSIQTSANGITLASINRSQTFGTLETQQNSPKLAEVVEATKDEQIVATIKESINYYGFAPNNVPSGFQTYLSNLSASKARGANTISNTKTLQQDNMNKINQSKQSAITTENLKK